MQMLESLSTEASLPEKKNVLPVWSLFCPPDAGITAPTVEIEA